MISKITSFAVALFLTAVAVTPAQASSIQVTIGNSSPPFANGAITTSMAALAAQAGSPAPFSAACGTDIGVNCVASWTFNYVIPSGEFVTSASLTLGLFDLDSHAADVQISNYSITGGDNLTVAFNAAAELADTLNNQYNVFTLPLIGFAALDGSTTVNLSLQKGLAALPTNFNGAALIYSQLNLTTAADNGNPTNPVPEPASTAMLLATSLGILVRVRAKTRDR